MAYFLFAKQHIVWKKIGTEKSLLFVNIELKNGEKINHENHFSKKDQQQHFAFIVMTSWRF